MLTIELSFLPVGHTHTDIDQLFSIFSNYLKSNNAITINEFHDVIRLHICWTFRICFWYKKLYDNE